MINNCVTFEVLVKRGDLIDEVQQHWDYEDAKEVAGSEDAIVEKAMEVLQDQDGFVEWIIYNNEDPTDSDAWLEHCVEETMREFV